MVVGLVTVAQLAPFQKRIVPLLPTAQAFSFVKSLLSAVTLLTIKTEFKVFVVGLVTEEMFVVCAKTPDRLVSDAIRHSTKANLYENFIFNFSPA
jgi:hypothetical protein